MLIFYTYRFGLVGNNSNCILRFCFSNTYPTLLLCVIMILEDAPSRLLGQEVDM